MTTHDDNSSAMRDTVRLYVERTRSTAPVARSWTRLQGQEPKTSRLASVRASKSAIASAIVVGLVFGGRLLLETRPGDFLDLRRGPCRRQTTLYRRKVRRSSR
jgi:hypothetical protein